MVAGAADGAGRVTGVVGVNTLAKRSFGIIKDADFTRGTRKVVVAGVVLDALKVQALLVARTVIVVVALRTAAVGGADAVAFVGAVTSCRAVAVVVAGSCGRPSACEGKAQAQAGEPKCSRCR